MQNGSCKKTTWGGGGVGRYTCIILKYHIAWTLNPQLQINTYTCIIYACTIYFSFNKRVREASGRESKNASPSYRNASSSKYDLHLKDKLVRVTSISYRFGKTRKLDVRSLARSTEQTAHIGIRTADQFRKLKEDSYASIGTHEAPVTTSQPQGHG